MKTSTILKALSVFSNFSESEIDFLGNHFQSKSMAEGDVILNEDSVNDTLYVVIRGIVEIRKKIEQQEIAVAFLTAGSFLGEGGLVGFVPQKAMAVAVARTPVEALTLSRDVMDLAAREQPAIVVKLLRLLATALSRKLNRLDEEYVSLFLQFKGIQKIHELKSLDDTWGV